MVLTVALIIGTILFGIGLYGALSQTNLVMIMMGVELMLGAVMVNLVAFWRYLHPESYSIQMFVLVVMTVMALEAAVGFAIGTQRFRTKGSIESEESADMKG
ncbi:NADH-quinone oxidoreductase subunit NuoK [Fodinibius sediminis]|jgi:NAD(P)H-quinone oxidoreductase subunit 4L|uniref:NADH-quinone oxidoreductase subunit K n=1 Tax=Fodinibius sediminis TaxID=1214077 RepID=A0A521EGH3_9BACT|nr:NADH-quinone oxidoreductase subunit NuoK [Fodinibius sediminis]SMO83014.1 NADH dehydrogenase subunit K [Fodinibius sediminis]